MGSEYFSIVPKREIIGVRCNLARCRTIKAILGPGSADSDSISAVNQAWYERTATYIGRRRNGAK